MMRYVVFSHNAKYPKSSGIEIVRSTQILRTENQLGKVSLVVIYFPSLDTLIFNPYYLYIICTTQLTGLTYVIITYIVSWPPGS